jgi:hypothetical protein
MGQRRHGNFSSSICRGSALSSLKNSKGQIIIEYILILLVVVSIAALLISRLAQRDQENPGILIKKWCEIQKFIGGDNPGSRAKSPNIDGC